MPDNLLTNTSNVRRQLSEAEEKFRRARNTVNRLKSELHAVDRKTAAQQKIALGAALLRAAEKHPRHTENLRRLILPEVTRDTDREALRGSVFDPFEGEGVTAADLAAAESVEGA